VHHVLRFADKTTHTFLREANLRAVNVSFMLFPILATTIRLIWVVVEYPYLRRNRVKPTQDWDKHSAKLWDAANLIEPIGMVLGFTGIGRIQAIPNVLGALGLLLLVAGITIRWAAVHTLGKYFTGTVVIKTDHQLIRTGLYKYVRHPAYSGTLLAHLGLGLSFSNWFSLSLSSIPYFIVALYRIHVEERALADAFGADYFAYARTAKRLIPRLY
jgi:protein-S-isoprenylcysteine O-methyltransferase Ste14